MAGNSITVSVIMSWMPRRRRLMSGFTILELMVILAVVGILATISATNFQPWLRGQRVSALARETFHALSVARAEAIKAGHTVKVTLGPRSLIVYEDANGDHRYEAGVGDTLLYPKDTTMFRVRRHMGISVTEPINGEPVVIFNAFGYSVDAENNPRSVQVDIRDAHPTNATSRTSLVIVTIAGSVRID